MATVYSYLRFSRPEQEKGDSFRRQTKWAPEWAAKHGHALDTTLDLRDRGVSAFRGKNAEVGALADFLEAIELGRVRPGDVLALENLDRLSRQQPMKSMMLIQQILGAGVGIVTFQPERVYTAENVNDMGTMLEMMVYLCRAYDESLQKSNRLKSAWRNKRADANQRKMTALAPAWLRPIKDNHGRVVRFESIPERAEVVQRIFRMAGEGAGYLTISKTLNAEGVPTFGKSKLWARSSVKKLLGNRAVLGEHQPHEMRDGRRVPVGEPIAGYFPAVVDERDFYAARQGVENRKSQPGRHTKRVANLFTGLVRDARDGSACQVVDKGYGLQLVSSAAKAGKPGAVYLAFPYEAFERALLVWACDLKLGDVLPRKATNLEAEVAKAEGRVADLSNRIATLKAKMKTADNFEALLDLLVELESDKAKAEAKVEQLKREMSTCETEALDRSKELIDRLQTADADEVYQLRLKLRAMLKRLVANIVMLPIQVNNTRVALVSVELRNGERQQLAVTSGKKVELPEGLEARDVRQWATWPKQLKESRFTVETPEVRKMVELDKRGFDRAEIAKQMGLTLSYVSKTLLRNGRRKQGRKPADHQWLMTWHPRGNGWAKRHHGKRYFIGLGRLAEAYPELVTTRDADGSWKAANAWWAEKLKELSKVS